MSRVFIVRLIFCPEGNGRLFIRESIIVWIQFFLPVESIRIRTHCQAILTIPKSMRWAGLGILPMNMFLRV